MKLSSLLRDKRVQGAVLALCLVSLGLKFYKWPEENLGEVARKTLENESFGDGKYSYSLLIPEESGNGLMSYEDYRAIVEKFRRTPYSKFDGFKPDRIQTIGDSHWGYASIPFYADNSLYFEAGTTIHRLNARKFHLFSLLVRNAWVYRYVFKNDGPLTGTAKYTAMLQGLESDRDFLVGHHMDNFVTYDDDERELTVLPWTKARSYFEEKARSWQEKERAHAPGGSG